MKFQQKLTYLVPMIVFYNDSYDKSLRRKKEAIKHDHTEAVHLQINYNVKHYLYNHWEMDNILTV